MCRETGIRATIVIGMLGILGALAACDPGSPDKAVTDVEAQQNADRMLREHEGDSGTPCEGAGIPPDRELVAETLAYAEVDDDLVYGHFDLTSDMVVALLFTIVISVWMCV